MKEQRNVSKYFLLNLHNEKQILLKKCRNVGYVINFKRLCSTFEYEKKVGCLLHRYTVARFQVNAQTK